MKSEKKFTLKDIGNRLMAIGGLGLGGVLSFAMLAQAPNIPLPPLLITLLAYGAGAIGYINILKISHREEINRLMQAAGMAQSLPVPGTQAIQAPPKLSPSEELEIRLLDCFALNQGKLSLVQAVVYLREPLDRIRPILDRLLKENIISTDVSEAGEVIYTTAEYQFMKN